MSDSLFPARGQDLFLLEDAVWLLTETINNPAYDFPFDTNFRVQRNWKGEHRDVLARIGAFADYEQAYKNLLSNGLRLFNSPQQHFHASQLPFWYPLIASYTPASRWYPTPPPFEEVEEHFRWPVFVKGSRQTSRHLMETCIAGNREEYQRLCRRYTLDPILRWQEFVVRQFVSLRPVSGGTRGKIKPSFEFRSFWWKKQLVGVGPYWSTFTKYRWNNEEKDACLQVAQKVAGLVDCPFLVIDLAQTVDGKWIVIECNDGQESGYAGVSPFALWNRISQIERHS